MHQKKKAFFEEKPSETIGKLKELWGSLKSLGMPNKAVISNFNATEDSNTLTHDTGSIAKIFKNFSNLAESLLIKLPKPRDTLIGESFARETFSNFAIFAKPVSQKF